MHIYLTRRSHLNSLYVNNDGQVLYKVQTPFKFVRLVSTIKSALPGDIPAPGSSSISDPSPPIVPINDNDVEGDDEFDEPDDDVDENDEPKEDTELYRGEEYETNKFFAKKEWGWHGFHRAFTGPDGLEYQWIFGFREPRLVRRDAARTPVARYHRRSLGVFGKARRRSLEIFPEGMHMVDLVVVTFVYIQKIRNDKASKPR